MRTHASTCQHSSPEDHLHLCYDVCRCAAWQVTSPDQRSISGLALALRTHPLMTCTTIACASTSLLHRLSEALQHTAADSSVSLQIKPDTCRSNACKVPQLAVKVAAAASISVSSSGAITLFHYTCQQSSSIVSHGLPARNLPCCDITAGDVEAVLNGDVVSGEGAVAPFLEIRGELQAHNPSILYFSSISIIQQVLRLSNIGISSFVTLSRPFSMCSPLVILQRVYVLLDSRQMLITSLMLMKQITFLSDRNVLPFSDR